MPYTCEKCNRKFSTKEYLRKHNNRKTACNAVYKCGKCGKKFPNANLLKRHNDRITPCAPETIPIIKGENEENMCHLCGKTYTTLSNLRRHLKSCNVKDNPNLIAKLLDQNQELLDIIKQNGLGNQVTNNITVNNTQNNNLYMNVTIIPFGDEDYSKLDSTQVVNLVKNHTTEFMPKMIEYIHANPNMPEYHNVFYDKQNKVAIKFTAISADTKTWVKTDAKEISDQISNKIKNHMHPLNSPYYNLSVQDNDYETANRVIDISTSKVDTLEENLESLSILTENHQFKKIVGNVD